MPPTTEPLGHARRFDAGRLVREYPLLFTALLVGIVAATLQLSGIDLLAQWILIAFAVFMAGRTAIGMVRRVRSGVWGIDALAITAIGATLAVQEFWAAFVIVLMLTTGEALEDYAGNRARRDLSALVDRAPRIAHVLGPDESLHDVDVDEVAPGDRLLIGADEVVPVDCRLDDDSAWFDESSLTGESVPVEHRAGDAILSGATNGSVGVTVTAVRVAGDSEYQQIVRLVEEATQNRPPLVRLADRYAVPFTILALALAGLAWWLSGDPARFAEVLVVATPCPLLVAAPVAFIAGMSRAARDGVIVKGGGALEQLRRAQTFVFDKTGTLTRGRPALVDVRVAEEHDPQDLLRLAALAEQASTHVLARATVDAAHTRGIAMRRADRSEETPANGVISHVEGHVVVVGKRAFVERVIEVPVPAEPLTAGEMAAYVAVDGRAAGALIFRDETRPNAAGLLRRLREQGVRRILMVTGDDALTARHVAQEVGVDEVHAQCLPLQKVDVIRGVRDRPVVMVGDGINDAPVLAAAEVGIAMGAAGATAASESADVVLLYDDLDGVGTVLIRARRTVSVALQSVWIGMVLSIGLMVVAAFGLLPALVGALLQEVVDVISILWALRALGGRTSDLGPVPAPPVSTSSSV